MGTTLDYFQHYRFARHRRLEFRAGRPFEDLFEAVIGADVAEELGYKVGQEISLSHGTDEVSFYDHGDKPFRISGILQKTGTPVDRTVHVSLKGMTALHLGWERGTPLRGHQWSAERAREVNLPPSTISAVLVGLKSRIAVLQMQQAVNEYKTEPLQAAVPGIALQELWDTIAIAQQSLFFITILVVVVGISGMAVAMLTGLNERRREMAVLRAVGARPVHIFALFTGEAAVIILTAGALGLGALYLGLMIVQPLISSRLGVYIPIGLPSLNEYLMLLGALVAGVLAGCLPAYLAYRFSLANGMTIRV